MFFNYFSARTTQSRVIHSNSFKKSKIRIRKEFTQKYQKNVHLNKLPKKLYYENFDTKIVSEILSILHYVIQSDPSFETIVNDTNYLGEEGKCEQKKEKKVKKN